MQDGFFVLTNIGYSSRQSTRRIYVDIVLLLHSLWRWVVVVVSLIALVKFGLGWFLRKTPDSLDRQITRAFTISIDIQVALGLILILLQWLGGVLLRPALEHAVIMIVAVILAHLTAMWRNRTDNTALRNSFLVVLAVVILIGVGVARVGGWTF
jgi:hypothetical protein